LDLFPHIDGRFDISLLSGFVATTEQEVFNKSIFPFLS